jgi:hypothetical protein
MSHDIAPRWNSVNDIIHQALYLSAYAGPGAFNDMDMLEVGRGLAKEEDKTHFGIWCMMASPLLIGCDLQQLRYSKVKSYAMDLLKNRELIALDQDPLCIQAYVAKRDGETYVLVKDIETYQGTTRAVAFLNTENANREMSIDLKDIEVLDLSSELVALDLDVLKQRYVAEALQFAGVESVPPEKRERLVSSEVTGAMGGTEALRFSRLCARQQACEEIKRIFGLDVSVRYRGGTYITTTDLNEPPTSQLEPEGEETE